MPSDRFGTVPVEKVYLSHLHAHMFRKWHGEFDGTESVLDLFKLMGKREARMFRRKYGGGGPRTYLKTIRIAPPEIYSPRKRP